MLKNIVQLEHIVEGRVYHLLCDNNSPLNEVKDALVKFIGYVTQVEDAAKAKQEADAAKAAETSEVEAPKEAQEE